jgi:hypothetical protein
MKSTFKFIEPKKERFRTIPAQLFLDFDEQIDVEKLKIVGYVLGNSVNMKTSLNVSMFDSISFFENTENEITKEKFIHAIGFRKKENKKTFLILK